MTKSELKEKVPLELAQLVLDCIKDIEYRVRGVRDSDTSVPLVSNIILISGYHEEHRKCCIGFRCDVITSKNIWPISHYFTIPYYDK